MLFRAGVVVFDEESVDVVIHGEPAGSSSVVPSQVDASIEVAMPVFGKVIVLLDYVTEVKTMLNADVFYAKVIDNEGEHDGMSFVSPEAWRMVSFIISICGQSLAE